MSILTKLKDILLRIFRRGKPAKKVQEPVKRDLLVSTLLEREYQELLTEKERIQLELKKLEEEFLRGKIDARVRDRYYKEKLAKAARITHRLIELKSQIEQRKEV
ncbi:MAG: hypothetical protein ACTSSJ_00795 [Candidatus Odinarchaeia archaeon]